jgi:hypothetical protein
LKSFDVTQELKALLNLNFETVHRYEFLKIKYFISLKELSYEIEMGCLWYGWKEPYLEMNL